MTFLGQRAAPKAKSELAQAFAKFLKSKGGSKRNNRSKPKPNKKPASSKPQRAKASGGESKSLVLSKPRASMDIFSPLSPTLVPTLLSEGKAFPTGGVFRFPMSNVTGSRKIVVIANTGVGGTLGLYVNNTTTPFLQVSTLPTLAAADDAGGPTSGRAMKCGVSIVNTTQRLNVGGRVTILNANQRFLVPAAPSAMTQAQWSAFADEVVGHPAAVSMGGADFTHPKLIVSHPVNGPEYSNYDEWKGTSTADNFASHWAIWPAGVPDARPMSTIVLVFEDPPVLNTYVLSMMAQYYTRWPINTILGQHMRPTPVAAAADINRHQQHAEAYAHVPRDGATLIE